MNWFKRRLINKGINTMMKEVLEEKADAKDTKRVAKMTTDIKTTVIGAALSALQVANVDFVKLMGGDLGEVGKALAAVLTAVLGWYINKVNPPTPPTTPLTVTP